MSISSDVTITREKALKLAYSILKMQQLEFVIDALNGMSNSDLARILHTDVNFYHVDGKGKLDKYEVLYEKKEG